MANGHVNKHGSFRKNDSLGGVHYRLPKEQGTWLRRLAIKSDVAPVPKKISEYNAEQAQDTYEKTCRLCGYYSYRTNHHVMNGYCTGTTACRQRQKENRGMGLSFDEEGS